MIRTQIYLTEEEQEALRTITALKGTSQSELIRQAIDQFIANYRQTHRVELLRAARGMWAGRDDLDWRSLRAEFDRSFGETEEAGEPSDG